MPGSPNGGARFYGLIALGAAGLAAALWLLSPLDLLLSRSLHQPGSAFGRIVLLCGEWPGWLAVLLCALGLVWSRRRPGLRRSRPLFLAVILLALLHPLLVTQALKFGWGRVRPADLRADASNYTPFFYPAGPGAGESFPSGHVAMSLAAAPLPFHLWRHRQRRAAAAAFAGLLALGVLVGLGRMVAGAHYATDCLFSLGLSFLLAAVIERRLGGAIPAGRPPV
ncbi:MAG: phosphatase PAP2 family protein [Myxococcales bacterium]|nr:phosphatase PAP2 family protein [Myxococcales bacterium]